MFKLIRFFIKLLQVSMVFLIPLIVLFWLLKQVNVEILKPIEGALWFILSPVITFVSSYVQYEIPYQGSVIDVTPLAPAGLCMIGYFVLAAVEGFVNFFDAGMSRSLQKIDELGIEREQEVIRRNLLNEMEKYKFTYLALKIVQNENSLDYLPGMDLDEQNEGTLEDFILKLKESAKHYGGKSVKNTGEADIHNYIFQDISQAGAFVSNAFLEAKGDYKISVSCHCAAGEKPSKEDLLVGNKIVSLAGENQVLASELFKTKYEVTQGVGLEIETLGMYNMFDSEVEVYQIKNFFNSGY